MLEEEIECRRVIAQNEKRYLSKVFVNKGSRNPKTLLSFHEPVPVLPMFLRSQYFLAFCLQHEFFWECVVLLCLKCARKFLFAVCKDTSFAECEDILFQCSVRGIFLLCAMKFYIQCGDLFLFAVSRIYFVFEWDYILCQELELTLFAGNFIVRDEQRFVTCELN